MTLYESLMAAGCEIDSHESDLYVKATPEARRIVCDRTQGSAMTPRLFTCQRTGDLMLEVPFAYDPWWAAHTAQRTAN